MHLSEQALENLHALGCTCTDVVPVTPGPQAGTVRIAHSITDCPIGRHFHRLAWAPFN